ncbi:ABC transporter substrate-binding protein [Pararhodospirillum photometricum]|uniref:ABC-type uncharacterized transport system,periplasmic component n=1 Tax=Pararhodospirillum photometricum DSM 122 TaxID=1150469 RepID=H6SLX5_PARPM|nr:ABC transporter substrate-binding protein [Pararhodospirillum photometricum]CCG08990.1 ABC-type uncharacterized transport system,periplasmic component [Pararhodospirillum photometricum DSM 122]
MSPLSWRLVGAGLLAVLLASAGVAAAEGDRPPPPSRIVMILFRGETDVERGFRDFLREEGIEAEITVRSLDRDLTRLPSVISEVRAARPDLVYTWGTGVALGVLGTFDAVAPETHIHDLPVLATMVSSPVGSRLVEHLGPSGRNFTAVSHLASLSSQLNAMRAYRTVTRLAVLYNPIESNAADTVTALRALCATEGIDLVAEPVPLDATGRPRADVLPDLVAKVAAREPQFLYIGPDTFIGDNRDTVTSEAIRHRIPVFTGTELEIRASNAMLGLVAPYYTLGKLAGFKAQQILVNKVDPGSLPVETLSRFTYVVKMSVARQLGLYPPMAVLDYAEIVP